MKAFYLLPLLGVLACSQHHIVDPTNVSKIAACDLLYRHVLEVQVDNTINWAHMMTLDERQVAIKLLDQEYQTRGTADNFYHYCYYKMTPSEINCDMSISSIEAMNTCKLSQ